MKNILLIVLFIFGSFSLSYSNDLSSNVLVGILEDDRAELANWKKGPSKNRIVRPLFEKKGDEWNLSTFHAGEIRWTIAFNGRNAGKIKSRPNTEISSLSTADTHVPEAQPDQSLIIGKPSKDFSGWQYTLFNRPLVLVSKESSNDPDKWKPFHPTEDQIKLFKKAFRTKYSKVINCDENEKPLPSPWSYKDIAIQFTKTYHSSNGDSLVGMFLEGGKCGINGGPFQKQLFLFRSDKTVAHITLGSRNPQFNDMMSLILVDAGDYDADGKSEVIFFLNGYNEDGYAMFYDSFQKSVMWTWSYH